MRWDAIDDYDIMSMSVPIEDLPIFHDLEDNGDDLDDAWSEIIIRIVAAI